MPRPLQSCATALPFQLMTGVCTHAGWLDVGRQQQTKAAAADARPASANGASAPASAAAADTSAGAAQDTGARSGSFTRSSARPSAAYSGGYTCVSAAQRGGAAALLAGTADGRVRWLDVASGACCADLYCRPLHRWQASLQTSSIHHCMPPLVARTCLPAVHEMWKNLSRSTRRKAPLW